MATRLTTPMGPGFFIFFQGTIDRGSGGYYKPLRKGRTYVLKPLEEYEKRIKKELKLEQQQLADKQQDITLQLDQIKSEDDIKFDKVKASLKKVLVDVESDIKITEAKLQIIPRLALIRRDDDEVLLILYS